VCGYDDLIVIDGLFFYVIIRFNCDNYKRERDAQNSTIFLKVAQSRLTFIYGGYIFLSKMGETNKWTAGNKLKNF